MNKKSCVAATAAIVSAVAGEALQNATGTFAKWFQKYPAK